MVGFYIAIHERLVFFRSFGSNGLVFCLCTDSFLVGDLHFCTHFYPESLSLNIYKQIGDISA